VGGGAVRVLIAGGGYMGSVAARRLQRPLARAGHEVVVVNPENFVTYQPFLPEAASGNIEPRHVVVPLRQVLRRCSLLVGEVTAVEHAGRLATVRTLDGEDMEVPYDVLVLGAGARSRILPIPGLADRGVGFKTVTEAIYLRNWVLSRLEVASEAADPERRRAALTFLFVGGGYSGVEALAELEDLVRHVMRYYPRLREDEMRWILVDAAPAILPEIGRDLAEYAVARLRRRGIEVRLGTRLESAEGGLMRLSDGDELAADTLVWTTGVKAESLASRSGFPVDQQGRVLTDEFLRVRDAEGVWAAGDCAAVPDLTTGGVCPPTAQHALRQARRLAENVERSLAGRSPRAFRYHNRGQMVSLGRYRGVAKAFRFRLRGFPAWALHRTYHLLMMPTFARKSRIVADWTVGLFFPRDVSQLGSLQHPREPFRRAADDG
jgi:NADH:ubiquinone reductase (H+-translocating)